MDLKNAFELIDNALRVKQTLVVVGTCRVRYHGRATSKLAEGDRIIMVKSDGSFLVHQNKNMAAINYQPPRGLVSTELTKDGLLLRAERKQPSKTQGAPIKEVLEAIFSNVEFAGAFDLRDDESLRVLGTEKNLSDLLMTDLSVIEPGLVPLKQESANLKGYIDIFAKDLKGNFVLVELKRRTAGLDAVTQLKRYVDEVKQRKDTKNVRVRGVLCAPGITENALSFIEKEGLEFRRLDYGVSDEAAEIKGLEKKQKSINSFF